MTFIINTAAEAVKMAQYLTGTGIYELGTGDNSTLKGGKSDCAGFAINKCYNIKRHRPGFNDGAWASVSDDINCNSAIEDAHHNRELFEATERPELGALITYPTFWSGGHQFVGHIAIIVDVPAEWDPKHPKLSKYKELIVVQCRGPNGRNPGIVLSNAGHWDAHDLIWPKPQHRTQLIKVRREVQGRAVG